jgi:hypothetical protein
LVLSPRATTTAHPNAKSLRGDILPSGRCCIIQTLRRALFEEVTFDRSRVTSTDWSSYPIMKFTDMPKLDIVLIDRPNEPPLGAGSASTIGGLARADACLPPAFPGRPPIDRQRHKRQANADPDNGGI